MKFKKYIILLFLIPTFAFTIHKYYVSLCEIEYIEEQQSIQIIIGLFIDDIEFSLNKIHNTNLYLATPKEFLNIDGYYEAYLNKHFKIKVNNSNKNYIFIGKEYNDDIVRFYLEITGIQSINSLEINNNCLFEEFEQQQNIVKLKIKNKYKTLYFNRKNNKGLLKF